MQRWAGRRPAAATSGFWAWFPLQADALKPREGVECAEEIAGDGGVVAKVHLPPLGRHGHEADGDGVVRV